MMNQNHDRINFSFFGTSHVAVYVLDVLAEAGFIPSLVVTMPDAPRGRGLTLASPAAKTWADSRGVPVLQPETLRQPDQMETMGISSNHVAIVCDYGKILPDTLLAAPKRGFLNVHPSLLPRLRGASPMRSAILNDEKNTGVSIMLVDAEMDHGPLVAQRAVDIRPWPPRLRDMERTLMGEGGRLLAQVLPAWVAGEIEARDQNHDIATYCDRMEKEDGLLDLASDPYKNLLKIRAYEGWPGTFAFFDRDGKKIRVKILDAHIEKNTLAIDRVVPEGKKEMSYADFLRSGARPL